jgi:NADH-quinone oxidoreductase subunit J
MVVVVGALRGTEVASVNFDSSKNTGLVKNLGNLLFNEFLLPFEIVSILLLAAMVGSVMLGKSHMKRLQDELPKRNGRARNRSAASIKNVNEITK